jgi:hypothetical protein
MQTKAPCRLLVSLVFAFCGNTSLVWSAPPPDSADAFFAQHTNPRLRLRLEEDALAALRNKFRDYTKATVMEGTNIWRDVGVHLKGQYGTFQGIDGRPLSPNY